MDQPAALRPLLEAADDIRRLEDYDTSEELSSAILAVVAAIDRSLRILLRKDTGAPDEQRLNAFAPDRLPLDEVVKALRTRDLISLEAAGTVHQACTIADRAATGEATAADGDAVAVAVERLRRELAAAGGAADGEIRSDVAGPVPGSVARSAARPGSTRSSGAPDVSRGSGKPVDPGDAGEPGGSKAERSLPADRWIGSRWMRWLAALFAAVIVVGVAWVAVRGGNADLDGAVAAFRAGRTDSAAVAFERVVEDQPRNVTAMLYLARSYRRLDRPAEAAEVLRRALEVEPEDGDVRRELGHLFMDLGRPVSAATQYERALEYEPEDPLSWAALIRSLRQMGDPRAEQLLREAPAEVRAALGGT